MTVNGFVTKTYFFIEFQYYREVFVLHTASGDACRNAVLTESLRDNYLSFFLHWMIDIMQHFVQKLISTIIPQENDVDNLLSQCGAVICFNCIYILIMNIRYIHQSRGFMIVALYLWLFPWSTTKQQHNPCMYWTGIWYRVSQKRRTIFKTL